MTKKTTNHRWSRHVYDAVKRMTQTHFARAIRKYGKEAFTYEVLEICHSLEVASMAERCWIELFDTRNPKNGFNLAQGGCNEPKGEKTNPWLDPKYGWNDPLFRHKHGEKMKDVLSLPESQQKMSEASQRTWKNPTYRQNHIKMATTFVQSPEWREKASILQKGRELSDITKDKISEASSMRQRKVPGYVSCGKHGLVSFADCYVHETKRMPRRSCKQCTKDRASNRYHDMESTVDLATEMKSSP